MKLNLGAGWAPIDGFVNLDKKDGWQFELGLDYEDGSIEGITISHALMYVEEGYWPFVFSELHRVLKTGGFVRITEDVTDNPLSIRYPSGNPDDPDLKTLTSEFKVLSYLRDACFLAYSLTPYFTLSNDVRMMQRLHGAPPHVFHVEGLR